MKPEAGYYGYTEGELVIMAGHDGTVGVQLHQGRSKQHARYTRGELGYNERKKPAKNAIAQAMRFELRMGVVEIGKLLAMAPQDVTRVTVLESRTRVIPWEVRKYQGEAIEAAKRILAERKA